MANQLIYETSPYLLQHAHNPVDWFPWGPEALEKALRENKPIFLSIGYAACHWCHVMEHETFEDPAIAELLNRHFVSIKVDREERPDLDSIYMNAVVTMTGQGGWPMSVFLTPQMEPFYGGTYFPPTRRYGMPAFKEVLHAIIQSWKNDSAEIIRVGRDLARHLQESNAWGQGTSNMSRTTVLQQATQALLATYDWENGGWGHAPRFPQPMAIEYLLIQATRGVEKALDAASHALKQMSRGGMYDVVGGGFHRYSTDNTWLVPHFEKMLYDNAQLALVYLHAYLLTGDTSFRNVCTETLDFLTREMRHPSGGFFSSLDADSEGEEGKYYLWTFEQINTALPNEEDRKLVIQAFSISTEGNFDGKNILQRQATLEDTAEKLGMSPSDLSSWLSEVLAKLLSARNLRARPLTDEKVLVSWNAVALRVFAEAARYLRREDYLETARENARFLLKQMYHDGRLLRAWRDGTARHNAYLEDYAGLIIGLLELYQSDPDVQWYQTANDLAEDMLQNFQDPQGGFFDTRNDHGSLLVRPKDFQDNATPSGNALAAAALLRLASYSEKGNWREITESMFQAVQKFLVQHPVAFACWLQGLDFYSGPVQQVALVGPISHPHSVEMTNLIWRSFRPRLVFAAADEPNDSRLPGLITGRKMLQGLPTAYVCEGFTCRLPVNDIGQFKEQLT